MDADGFSVAELRKMAFEDKGPLSRPLALALLGRKRYPRKTQDLERFVMDETETPRLRNMAALELGRLGTPAAVKALERGLSVKEDVSLRGVLEGISLTGVDRIHPEINRLKRRKGPVGETARRTAALLSHRRRNRRRRVDHHRQMPWRPGRLWSRIARCDDRHVRGSRHRPPPSE